MRIIISCLSSRLTLLSEASQPMAFPPAALLARDVLRPIGSWGQVGVFPPVWTALVHYIRL